MSRCMSLCLGCPCTVLPVSHYATPPALHAVLTRVCQGRNTDFACLPVIHTEVLLPVPSLMSARCLLPAALLRCCYMDCRQSWCQPHPWALVPVPMLSWQHTAASVASKSSSQSSLLRYALLMCSSSYSLLLVFGCLPCVWLLEFKLAVPLPGTAAYAGVLQISHMGPLRMLKAEVLPAFEQLGV